MPVVAVGHHTAKNRENSGGKKGGEYGYTQQRFGTGNGIDNPGGRRLLHPGAHQRERLTKKEKPEVIVPESAERGKVHERQKPCCNDLAGRKKKERIKKRERFPKAVLGQLAFPFTGGPPYIPQPGKQRGQQNNPSRVNFCSQRVKVLPAGTQKIFFLKNAPARAGIKKAGGKAIRRKAPQCPAG